MLALLLSLAACGTDKPLVVADDTAVADDTGAPDSNITENRYHPVGFDSSGVHGIAAKMQEEDCLSCHGDDLTGGSSGVSCDSCHPSDWRTDCTFCHGGSADPSGAPPEDIDDGETDLSFPGHTAHVTETIHTAWGCEQCHVVPDDPLSDGHFLVGDDSPGEAEVDLSGGLSADGRFDGSCSNLYCHGDGQSESGTVAVDETVVCGDCHAGPDSGSWDRMGGEHSRHMSHDVLCSECHADTASEAGEVVGTEFHVDGEVEYALPEGMSEISGTCNGVCHSEIHLIRTWD